MAMNRRAFLAALAASGATAQGASHLTTDENRILLAIAEWDSSKLEYMVKKPLEEGADPFKPITPGNPYTIAQVAAMFGRVEIVDAIMDHAISTYIKQEEKFQTTIEQLKEAENKIQESPYKTKKPSLESDELTPNELLEQSQQRMKEDRTKLKEEGEKRSELMGNLREKIHNIQELQSKEQDVWLEKIGTMIDTGTDQVVAYAKANNNAQEVESAEIRKRLEAHLYPELSKTGGVDFRGILKKRLFEDEQQFRQDLRKTAENIYQKSKKIFMRNVPPSSPKAEDPLAPKHEMAVAKLDNAGEFSSQLFNPQRGRAV